MRILEREAPAYTFTPIPEISHPPVIDFKRARLAKKQGTKFTRNITGDKRFPAAELAVSLAMYNHNLPGFSSEPNPQLVNQLKNLVQEEVFMETYFPFIPPIGIELEAPMKPLGSQTETKNLPYTDFFEAIGMPDNISSSITDFWEFSPMPAYSHQVTSRIVSELVKGGFIPSLASVQQADSHGNSIPRFSLNNQETQKIHTLLKKKLVSLHINLGIPNSVHVGNRYSNDVIHLGAIFALAYTSPLRLRMRTMNTIAWNQTGLPTTKSSILLERLEMKPFELRDASVYKLLEQIQIVSSSLFAYHSVQSSELSALWESLQEETRPFWITNHKLDKETIRYELSERSMDRNASAKLRSILHKYTAVIRKPLLTNVPLPKIPDASILLPIRPSLRKPTTSSS